MYHSLYSTRRQKNLNIEFYEIIAHPANQAFSTFDRFKEKANKALSHIATQVFSTFDRLKEKVNKALSHIATQVFSTFDRLKEKVNRALSHIATQTFPTFENLKNKTNKTYQERLSLTLKRQNHKIWLWLCLRGKLPGVIKLLSPSEFTFKSSLNRF